MLTDGRIGKQVRSVAAYKRPPRRATTSRNKKKPFEATVAAYLLYVSF